MVTESMLIEKGIENSDFSLRSDEIECVKEVMMLDLRSDGNCQVALR